MTEVLILDASAFIAGYEMLDKDIEHISVPAVVDEIKEGNLARLRLEKAKLNRSLKIVIPETSYVKEVQDISLKLGEKGILSKADKQLLALALQLKRDGMEPIIVSDDYSIQNIADQMTIRFQSFTTRGIVNRFKWTIYCPGCKKKFRKPQKENICPVCGTIVKRKPSDKHGLTKRILRTSSKLMDEANETL